MTFSGLRSRWMMPSRLSSVSARPGATVPHQDTDRATPALRECPGRVAAGRVRRRRGSAVSVRQGNRAATSTVAVTVPRERHDRSALTWTLACTTGTNAAWRKTRPHSISASQLRSAAPSDRCADFSNRRFFDMVPRQSSAALTLRQNRRRAVHLKTGAEQCADHTFSNDSNRRDGIENAWRAIGSSVALEVQLGVTAQALRRPGTWPSAIPARRDPRSGRSSCSRSSLSDVAAQPPRPRRSHRPIPRARIHPICSLSQSKTVWTRQIR